MSAHPNATSADPGTARAPDALRSEVLAGLRAERKTLHPKLFYDARGAALFDRITGLDEYYLTNAEVEILDAHGADIAALAGSRCALLEYGSGAGVKVRLLLDAFAAAGAPIVAYVPIDISREQLVSVAAQIATEYPDVPVQPVCADYTTPLSLPDLPQRARRIAFFPGSTIGNFHPAEAAAFLRRIRRTVADDGGLVLGVDRRKDPRVLEAAYNDTAGVTAAFNRNILVRINRELGANFDASRFEHRAVFDDAASRMEMHLVSLGRQTVQVGDEVIVFQPGETIWTESSYKYDLPRLSSLADAAGFRIERLWSDASEQFWVGFLTAAGAPARQSTTT